MVIQRIVEEKMMIVMIIEENVERSLDMFRKLIKDKKTYKITRGGGGRRRYKQVTRN